MSDENDEFVEAGNIINEILIAHKEKWNGDDEIQDMLAEAFVLGVKYWQDKLTQSEELQGEV